MTDKELDQQKKTKIYLITNEEGKFMNVEIPTVPYFTTKLWLGSFATEKGKKAFDKNIEYLNRIGTFGTLKMFETNAFEYLAASSIETTTTIITLDICAKRIEVARDMIPGVSLATKEVRKSMLNTSGKIKFISPMFEQCVTNNEDFTYDNRGAYEEMIGHMAELEMWEIAEANELFRARKKNKKTILGSAKRINSKKE